jgi:hypothetical protein
VHSLYVTTETYYISTIVPCSVQSKLTMPSNHRYWPRMNLSRVTVSPQTFYRPVHYLSNLRATKGYQRMPKPVVYAILLVENDITTGAHSHPKFFIAKTRCFIACRSVYGDDFEANLGHLGSLSFKDISFWHRNSVNRDSFGHIPSLTVTGQITIRQGFFGNLAVGQRVGFLIQPEQRVCMW